MPVLPLLRLLTRRPLRPMLPLLLLLRMALRLRLLLPTLRLPPLRRSSKPLMESFFSE
jgi:hypothetical protein